MQTDIHKIAKEIDLTDWRESPVDYGRCRLGLLSCPATEKATAR